MVTFNLPPERLTVAKGALSEVKRLFEGSKAAVETRVVSDKEPDDYIRDAVEKEGFDLVILGCTGEHSKIKRFMGTVPAKVINDAPCDVLIVR